MTQTIFWGKYSPYPNNKEHSVDKKKHINISKQGKSTLICPFFSLFWGDRFSHTVDFGLIQALGLICLVLLRK